MYKKFNDDSVHGIETYFMDLIWQSATFYFVTRKKYKTQL